LKELNYPLALELAQQVLRQEVETIQALIEGLGDDFWKCAQLLSNCPGLVWTTGVGTSASVAARFAHNLTCCGARAMFLSPADGLHGHTGVMVPDDLLVAMSRGGESSDVIQMVNIANKRRVITIAFVHDTDSTLARACRQVLPIRSRQEYELMGYLATTSTVAFSAMCDALCAIVLEAREYTPEQFGHTHPEGAVGRALSSSRQA
jgi:D-arabinose 5-phosphate isomerase GutQ